MCFIVVVAYMRLYVRIYVQFKHSLNEYMRVCNNMCAYKMHSRAPAQSKSSEILHASSAGGAAAATTAAACALECLLCCCEQARRDHENTPVVIYAL